MSIRYIQTAVSDNDHYTFAEFALRNDMTMGDLIEIAVREYITKRKEADKVEIDRVT